MKSAKLTLAIETSCDDTSVAIVDQDYQVLSQFSQTQIEPQEFGGVVPELAARAHLRVIIPLLQKNLGAVNLKPKDISQIAYTVKPGLKGSLMVGSITAQTIAKAWKIPAIPVDHILGHALSFRLNSPQIANTELFPVLALVVSGGHTQIMQIDFNPKLSYQIVGQTLDDAVGECLDKIAKMLGLGFPGGPAIQKQAMKGDSKSFHWPIPKIENPFNFSFSGIKTAVLRELQREQGIAGNSNQIPDPNKFSNKYINNISASVQNHLVDELIRKFTLVQEQFPYRTLTIGGGVSANTLLRETLLLKFPDIIFPDLAYTTDNAAMIAVPAILDTHRS